MSDIAQEVGATFGAAVQTGIKQVEAVGETVIGKIASGAVKVWHEAEALIDADAQKVKNVLPASALPGFDAVVSDIKQGASDALSTVVNGTGSAAPAFVKGLEGLADNALVAGTNGAALPLVPIVNEGIDKLAALGIAALQAWALKAKANLAQPVSHG